MNNELSIIVAACYVRVSTIEQAKNGNSIPEQTERIQKYCEAMGWTLYKIYTDAGYSGSNQNRPGLQALVADAKAHRINKVIVYKLDRLSRSQKDTLNLIEDVFLANGVDFVSMSENFDTSTPFGRAMVGILAVFAQLEREQIKERMYMGKEAVAKRGGYVGGPKVPYGYRVEDGEYVLDEFAKLQVQEVFRLTLEGYTPFEVAKSLNSRGLLRDGNPWSARNVRLALVQKAYIGYKKFGNVWHKSGHEQAIDAETFEAVQKIVGDKREKAFLSNPKPGLATSYLAGLIFCAHCGSRFSLCTDNYRRNGNVTFYRYYRCNTRAGRTPGRKNSACDNVSWRAEKLEELVFSEIRKLALSPQTETDARKTRDGTEALQKELVKIDTQINRLLDLYAIGSIPVDAVQKRIEEANAQKGAIEAEIAAIRQRETEETDRKAAFQLALSLSGVLDRGEFREIRAILMALIDKIVVDGEDITIFWNF